MPLFHPLNIRSRKTNDSLRLRDLWPSAKKYSHSINPFHQECYSFRFMLFQIFSISTWARMTWVLSGRCRWVPMVRTILQKHILISPARTLRFQWSHMSSLIYHIMHTTSYPIALLCTHCNRIYCNTCQTCILSRSHYMLIRKHDINETYLLHKMGTFT